MIGHIHMHTGVYIHTYTYMYISIHTYTHICIYRSQSPNSFHPLFLPLVAICLISASVSLFLPCRQVHLYHFSRFHLYTLIYNICFFLVDLQLLWPRYKSLKWTLQFLFCKKSAQGGWEMHRCQSWSGLKLPLPGFPSSALTHCRSQSSLKMRTTYYSLIVLKVYLRTWHRASVQSIFVERMNKWTGPEQ